MQKSLAIADIGATTGRWVILDDPKPRKVTTRGFHAISTPPGEIEACLREALAKLDAPAPDSLHLYGAGIRSLEEQDVMGQIIARVLPHATFTLHSDLEAVAHALCGEMPGIIGILGTGSNAGLYTENRIEQARPALGYLLGDEGSGYSIGRQMIRAYLDNALEREDALAIEESFGTHSRSLISEVYRSPDPKRFIAQFARYGLVHLARPPYRGIVREALQEFVQRYILLYPPQYEVYLSGAVAYQAKDLLSQVLNESGYTLAMVVADPMDRLVQFYKTNRKH